jgi:hypothetical protein
LSKKLVLNIFFIAFCVVAANNKNKKPTSDEPVLYKRERNKINSLARALQLEHALYQDETVMRFAAT